ncbi:MULTISPECIES: peptidase domain-containing ABC transporter [unclassified Streptomyces]|uniref:peptidase domain-containing ABC transporter n=1 Tax=unclassified Streptomyces TaxID=2593676 RepID=UPI00081EE79B|nr:MULTISPECIES: ABC transporter transmembrane domain-containing protein [unclassified Streptomyces]MYR95907.1 ATP-binding cassette domain-containing protein [Streptomyces sp. SID4937]SCD99521.1 ABC-type bacteriocin/lantibiotic exporter, contains an N-terminal double-glycine peptidase domain [Streptomyces sp. ScaeMP-e83]
MLTKKTRKYHIQQEGETDCGPAAAWMVLKRHSVSIDMPTLRDSVGLGQGGCSLLRLRESLNTYGVPAESYEIPLSKLAEALKVTGPAVAHVERESTDHFVVVHGLDRTGKLLVSDPSFLDMYTVSVEDFGTEFTGKLLLTDAPTANATGTRSTTKGVTSLVALVSAYRSRIVAVSALSVVVAVIAISTSLFLQFAVDRYLGRESARPLTLFALGFICITLFGSMLQFVQGRMVVTLGQQIQKDLSSSYVDKLVRLPVRFFNTRRIGDLVSRLDDIQQLQTLATGATIGVCVDVGVIVVVGAYLAAMNLLMFSMLLVAAGAGALIAFLSFRSIRETAEQSLQHDSTLKAVAVNLLSGFDSVVSYSLRPMVAERLATALERRISAQSRLGRLHNGSSVARNAVVGGFSIAAAWVGLIQLRSGAVSLGEVFAFYTMAGYFLASIESVAELQVMVQSTSAALGRYRDVLLQEEDARVSLEKAPIGASSPPPAGPGRPESSSTPHDVVAHDLTYTHPQRSTPCIESLSFEIPAGSRVSVRGANGTGKSTLLKLIAGFHVNYSGTITLGGTSLSGMPDHQVRKAVLYVPETPMVISGTLLENLRLDRDFTEDDVWAACRAACFDTVVQRLPSGFRTLLREDRSALSHGEHQRMSIARSILNGAPVLLLDESMSGIDPGTAQKIWENLSMSGKTLVSVSHNHAFDADASLCLGPKGQGSGSGSGARSTLHTVGSGI